MPTLSLETIAAKAGIPETAIAKLHQLREMLSHCVSDDDNEQTRSNLYYEISVMERRFQNSVALVNWRSNNKAAEYIVIPNTNLGEPRLTNDTRRIIRGIIKLAFRHEYMLDDFKYQNLFLTKEFVVWAADPSDRNWSSLEDEEKLNYVKSVGIVIELFVRGQGDEIPKDIQLLINYLKEITSFDKFNRKVVFCHSSLLCYNRAILRAEYLYYHVRYKLEAEMPPIHPYNQPLIGDFYNLVKDHFNPISCGNLKDLDNWFMRQAYPNSMIRHIHNLINSRSDENIANSIFGYLLVMKYGVDYYCDSESGEGIILDEVDNWLFIMNPEYMSKLVQTFIENDILPDCWRFEY